MSRTNRFSRCPRVGHVTRGEREVYIPVTVKFATQKIVSEGHSLLLRRFQQSTFTLRRVAHLQVKTPNYLISEQNNKSLLLWAITHKSPLVCGMRVGFAPRSITFVS